MLLISVKHKLKNISPNIINQLLFIHSVKEEKQTTNEKVQISYRKNNRISLFTKKQGREKEDATIKKLLTLSQ